MRNAVAAIVIVGFLNVALACGSSTNEPAPANDADGGADATASADATADADVSPQPPIDGSADADGGPSTLLVSRAWSLAMGEEAYFCIVVPVTQDLWISAFDTLAPKGTHRMTLSVQDTPPQTGEFSCSTATIGEKALYSGGTGTGAVTMPASVGMHVAAGKSLLLNIHAFNDSEQALVGTSGVSLQLTAAASLVHEADLAFVGRVSGPPIRDGQTVVHVGDCTLTAAWNIVGISPHMRGLGVHQRLDRKVGGNVVATLHDADYSHLAQAFIPITAALQTGDTLAVGCTFVNNASGDVFFSDSYGAETCVAAVYKYPVGGAPFSCLF